MNRIKVIDARMGRGKTSAAINYMNEHKDRNFMYITLYLDEVNRICNQCGFVQPEAETGTKLGNLKALLHKQKSISSTHSLFKLLDRECLELINKYNYSIIIDEAIDCISKINITKNDVENILTTFAHVNDDGIVEWDVPDYTGKYGSYMKSINQNRVYCVKNSAASTFISVMNPDILKAFDQVIMLTYLFKGQFQRAYLDLYGFEYDLCGVECVDQKYKFTDRPDSPPPVNYSELINIVDDEKMNSIGDRDYSLSLSWYDRRTRANSDMKIVRNKMNVFFRRISKSESSNRIWTCYKSHLYKLVGDRNRYANNFLQLSAKATNKYSDCTAVAYMVNRYVDPNILKFFNNDDVNINADQYALSEMIQFIWRSAIRKGWKIDLYIPSKRMRTLLRDWLEQVSKGGVQNNY